MGLSFASVWEVATILYDTCVAPSSELGFFQGSPWRPMTVSECLLRCVYKSRLETIGKALDNKHP